MLLAPLVGSVEAARRLSFEKQQLYLAELDHAQRVSALRDALSSLQPPSEGDDEKAIKSQQQWQLDYDENMLKIVVEDCCHHLPLDSEFGEQLDPPPLEHWREAPGVKVG